MRFFKYVNDSLTQDDDYDRQTQNLAHTDLYNKNKLLVLHYNKLFMLLAYYLSTWNLIMSLR